MAVSITYNKKDLEEIKKNIKEKLRRMQEMKTPLSMIAIQLYQSVMKNFQEEGTDKRKWEPLSQFTLWVKKVRKRKRTERVKTLQDTGYLRQSIVPVIGENYAQVGTNVVYGRLHQFGGTSEPSKIEIGDFHRSFPKTYRGKPVKIETIERRTRKDVFVHGFVMNIKGGHKIPARPFLTIRDDSKQRIINICRNWFFKGTT